MGSEDHLQHTHTHIHAEFITSKTKRENKIDHNILRDLAWIQHEENKSTISRSQNQSFECRHLDTTY